MSRLTRSLALAAALGVGLVGCATSTPADEPTPSAPRPSEPTPSPTASAAPDDDAATAEPAVGIDTSGWLAYETDDGEVMFRYPADWTLETESFGPLEGVGPDGNRVMDAASLTTPYGQTLLRYGDGVDLGGACIGDDGQPTFLPLEVLTSEPLAGAHAPTQIATVALGVPDGTWYVGVGLVDPAYLERDTYCNFNFATASSQGLVLLGTSLDRAADGDLWLVDTLDDATAYLETDEHETLLEILRSVRLS